MGQQVAPPYGYSQGNVAPNPQIVPQANVPHQVNVAPQASPGAAPNMIQQPNVAPPPSGVTYPQAVIPQPQIQPVPAQPNAPPPANSAGGPIVPQYGVHQAPQVPNGGVPVVQHYAVQPPPAMHAGQQGHPSVAPIVYGNQQPVYNANPQVVYAQQQQQQVYVPPPMYANQQAPYVPQQQQQVVKAQVKQEPANVVGVKPAGPQPQANAQQYEHDLNSGTSEIANQWDREMKDFMPQMILTFKLNGGESEHFHQDVSTAGTLIRGGYFESVTDGGSGGSGSQRRQAVFKILSPSGKLIHTSEKTEGLFRLACEETGTYTFALSSPSGAKPKFVTFVMGTGEVSALTSEDINSIEGNIKMLYRTLNEVETHNNLLWVRHRSQAEQIRKTTNKTYYAFIIEMFCTAAAIIAQITTVKNMLAKRSLY